MVKSIVEEILNGADVRKNACGKLVQNRGQHQESGAADH